MSALYRWLEEAKKGRWRYAGDGHLVLVQGPMPEDVVLMEKHLEYIHTLACE